MKSQKIDAGEVFPPFSAVSVEEGTTLDIGAASGKWQLVVVYRGKHCPRCKTYLNTLEKMQSEWVDAGLDIMVVSADSREKAQADIAEFGWTFPVACELPESEMRKLGLYISDPINESEADGRFAEPAVFCIRPDGGLQIVSISNSPAARPDLAELLSGIVFNIKNDRPVRGMVV